MPSYKFGDAEAKTFELLPKGNYPFEITGVDFGISTGKTTGGSPVIELKVMLFKDKTFGQKLSQIFDNLILCEKCEWRVDHFVKSSNLLVDSKPPAKGQNIDFSEDALVGLRGWVAVKVEDYTTKAGEKKQKNVVDKWLFDREKIEKHVVEPASKPEPEDDCPF